MRRSSGGLVDDLNSVRDALVCVSKSEAGGGDGLDGREKEDDEAVKGETLAFRCGLRARGGRLGKRKVY